MLNTAIYDSEKANFLRENRENHQNFDCVDKGVMVFTMKFEPRTVIISNITALHLLPRECGNGSCFVLANHNYKKCMIRAG